MSSEIFFFKKDRELQNTASYIPEQNRRAGRNIRTIMENAGSVLHRKGLPLFLLVEAVNTAVCILIHVPSSQSFGSAPYELWTGKQLPLKHIRIFVS